MKDNRIKALQDGLIEALLLDLQDDSKRTPGLYTVIRGLINDNRSVFELDPTEPSLARLTKLIKDSAPFKLPPILIDDSTNEDT